MLAHKNRTFFDNSIHRFVNPGIFSQSISHLHTQMLLVIYRIYASMTIIFAEQLLRNAKIKITGWAEWERQREAPTYVCTECSTYETSPANRVQATTIISKAKWQPTKPYIIVYGGPRTGLVGPTTGQGGTEDGEGTGALYVCCLALPPTSWTFVT